MCASFKHMFKYGHTGYENRNLLDLSGFTYKVYTIILIRLVQSIYVFQGLNYKKIYRLYVFKYFNVTQF